MPKIYDSRVLDCGEGPLWHPLRQELFWVDIPSHRILHRKDDTASEIKFDEFVTALGWVDDQHIIASTETGLFCLNIQTHEKRKLCAVEADNPLTRSNDGRADPWGGFWISTMGKNAEPSAGSIYRYFDGELKTIVSEITIPNGICFNQSRNIVFFADTATQKMFSIKLDEQSGEPTGSPQLFLDLSSENKNIDGAIVDRSGYIWAAIWDGTEILKISPDAKIVEKIETGALRPTCPAFIGPDYKNLITTTAAIGLYGEEASKPWNCKTLIFEDVVDGVPEPQVRIESLVPQ